LERLKYKKKVGSVEYKIRRDGSFYVLEVISLKTKGIATELKQALDAPNAYIKHTPVKKAAPKSAKKEPIVEEKEFITLYKIVLPKRKKTKQLLRDVEEIGKIFSTLKNYPVFEIYIRKNKVVLEQIQGLANAKTIQAAIHADYPAAKTIKGVVKSTKEIKKRAQQKMAYQKKEPAYIEKIAKPLYKIEVKAKLEGEESAKAKLFFQKVATEGEYALKIIKNADKHTITISGIEHPLEAEEILELIVPHYPKSILKKYYILEMI
jgi:hypothetical protein